MQSLKDKLLKAGLVTEESIKKSESKSVPTVTTQSPSFPSVRVPQLHASRPAQAYNPKPSFVPDRLPKFAPLVGSKEANRLAARAQHELDRKIRDRVQATKVEIEFGESVFHFVTRKNKLRRLELTPALHLKIESGELAIVEWPLPDKIEHALVPTPVALELKNLSPRAVRFLKGDEVNVGFDDESTVPEVVSADQPEPEPAGEKFITIKRSPI